MKFIPNDVELKLIEKITKYHHQAYSVVRLTPTMLHKSIIDAGESIRKVLKNGSIVNYDTLDKGVANKIMKEAILITDKIYTLNSSFYRPETKNGDPRFWIYGLKKHTNADDLIYLTTYKEQLVVIPLVERAFQTELIQDFFKEEQNEIKLELFQLIKTLKDKGPVISVSPTKSNPKDVGDTLERELGILPNSLKSADFKGSIELKAKRKNVKTNDTLFSMIPDWSSSLVNSSPMMIKNFGYTSSKYEDFIDLFVTVSNKPNNQKLYLKVDEEQNKLSQYYINEKEEHIETCIWHLDELEERLNSKHPATLWLLADQITINDEIYYHYNEAIYSQKPIFSSFLLLISKGYVTYDWRGRVKEDGTGYKDKGHCFRIKPKYRNMLFSSTEIVEL